MGAVMDKIVNVHTELLMRKLKVWTNCAALTVGYYLSVQGQLK